MKIFALITGMSMSWQLLCLGGVPEPDNIVYGVIYIGGNQVTAANTNVVVEALLATNGPVIASYAMGTLATAGNFYSLRLSLENSTPSSPSASEPGDSLYLAVVDKTGMRYQQLIKVGARLAIQRVDFGQAASILDTNNLPTAWETYYFATTGLNPNALTVNGQTIMENYIAGTSPINPTDAFTISLVSSNEQSSVWFLTRPATGIGYTNVSRHYALNYEGVLGSGLWLGVAGYSNIVGNGQTVTFTAPLTNPMTFYRGRVWLQTP